MRGLFPSSALILSITIATRPRFVMTIALGVLSSPSRAAASEKHSSSNVKCSEIFIGLASLRSEGSPQALQLPGEVFCAKASARCLLRYNVCLLFPCHLGRVHGKGTMPTDVVMPQMGESIFEGTITKWLKKQGDKIQRDEPLFEISTDKVDAEIPAPASGILQEIKV